MSPSRWKPTDRSSCWARSRQLASIPFINGMTVQKAIAVAGGFGPACRAQLGQHHPDGQWGSSDGPGATGLSGPPRRYDQYRGTLLLTFARHGGPSQQRGSTMAHQRGLDHAPLRVMHVLRAPLGGLYRHVLDLSRERMARGCSSSRPAIIALRSTRGSASGRRPNCCAPFLPRGAELAERSARAGRRDVHPERGARPRITQRHHYRRRGLMPVRRRGVACPSGMRAPGAAPRRSRARSSRRRSPPGIAARAHCRRQRRG